MEIYSILFVLLLTEEFGIIVDKKITAPLSKCKCTTFDA